MLENQAVVIAGLMLLTILFLGFILAGFDWGWIWIFRNVLRIY